MEEYVPHFGIEKVKRGIGPGVPEPGRSFNISVKYEFYKKSTHSDAALIKRSNHSDCQCLMKILKNEEIQLLTSFITYGETLL